MKLIELNPMWVGSGGEGITDAAGNPVPHREEVGVRCDCPCGCGSSMYVPFSNPKDGKPSDGSGSRWERSGDTFETLTLSPSIRRIPINGSCGWHGFIKNGKIETCDDSIFASDEFIEMQKRGTE